MRNYAAPPPPPPGQPAPPAPPLDDVGAMARALAARYDAEAARCFTQGRDENAGQMREAARDFRAIAEEYGRAFDVLNMQTRAAIEAAKSRSTAL